MMEELITPQCGGVKREIAFPNEEESPLVTQLTDRWAISEAD